MKFYFHPREAHRGTPAGQTVSKHETLPAGEFVINEYNWPGITLWFVELDEFTADERQAAYTAYVLKG